jgi:hypothetical protein
LGELLLRDACRLLRHDAGVGPDAAGGEEGRLKVVVVGEDVWCDWVGVVRPPNRPIMSSTLEMLFVPAIRWPGAHVVRLFLAEVTESSLCTAACDAAPPLAAVDVCCAAAVAALPPRLLLLAYLLERPNPD